MAIRLVVTLAIWLLPAGLAVAAHHMPRLAPLYPAGLALATAVTAPVIADELRARGGDSTYDSCLLAIGDHQRAAAQRRARHAEGGGKRPDPPRRLGSVPPSVA